jgi:hypothetical protein
MSSSHSRDITVLVIVTFAALRERPAARRRSWLTCARRCEARPQSTLSPARGAVGDREAHVLLWREPHVLLYCLHAHQHWSS